MKRSFSFGFGTLLLLQSITSVAPETIEGIVLFGSPFGEGGLQSFTPWIKPENVLKDSSKVVEITVSSSSKLRVECEDYNNDNPRAFIYTPSGVLMETLNLQYINDVCNQIQSYVLPKEHKLEKVSAVLGRHGMSFQTLSVIYLVAGKQPRCVERKYKIRSYPFQAVVRRNDFPSVDCPEHFKSSVAKGASAGGIVNLGPVGNNFDTNYVQDIATRGVTKELALNTLDKSIKLMCREDTLHETNVLTKKKTIAIAWIIHMDNEMVVLDKFMVESCEVEDASSIRGININRRIDSSVATFKVVFKNTNKLCYERVITMSKFSHMHFYDQTRVEQSFMRNIRCPKKWTGDIGLNERVPWYKLLFSKRKPFMT